MACEEQDCTILHCDLNNFYASVEQILDPELKGKAIAVAGDPEKRHGVILAKSNEAKRAGIKTAETIWQAKQKCPELIVVAPHHRKYSEYSKRVKEIYLEYTSEVESFGLDECWLDVAASRRLFGTPEQIAQTIRRRIKTEIGLTVSIGVSFSKVFAKLGSDYKKPDAVTVFDRENYKQIVWSLPVEEMLYVGKSTAIKLHELGVQTIGDLARMDTALLINRLGKIGGTLSENARGIEIDGVKTAGQNRIPESVGHGMTMPMDIDNAKDAETVLYSLSDLIATRLRKYGRVGEGIAVSFRDSALDGFTRQQKISPSDSAAEIASAASELLRRYYDFATMPPLRTITIGVFDLQITGDAYQPDLFHFESEKSVRIGQIIDELRDKYGYGVIQKGMRFGTVFCADDGTDEELDYIPFQRDR